MAAYSSFALLGAGGLGSFVVTELLKQKASVKVLTRDDTKPELDAFKQSGATIVKIDYTNEEDLKKALSNVQVVVSTIGQGGLGLQVPIAKAAKTAGVKLFVPAEYGVTATDSFGAHKKKIHDLLTELHLPYTLFYTGFFAEIFPFFFGYNYTEGHIKFVGKGESAFSITGRPDIARFIAHVLTTAAPSELAWAKFHIEGDRITPHQVAELAEKKLGKSFEIASVDYDESRAKYDSDIVAFLSVLTEEGRAVSGTEEEVSTTIAKFFPDWNPTKYEVFISA